jgi:hypothetical protein
MDGQAVIHRNGVILAEPVTGGERHGKEDSTGFSYLSQQLETEVNGPDGANRLFTFIGRFDTLLAAFAGESEKETYTLLLGPEFDRREFHRAIATVSLADFGSQPGAGTIPRHGPGRDGLSNLPAGGTRATSAGSTSTSCRISLLRTSADACSSRSRPHPLRSAIP